MRQQIGLGTMQGQDASDLDAMCLCRHAISLWSIKIKNMAARPLTKQGDLSRSSPNG